MKREFTYHENTLAYTDTGNSDGYPILIQHGLIASIADEGLFTRLIRLGTRVIGIARPGYGASSPYAMRDLREWADIVAVLVDELTLSRFDVLAMSSGALYGYALGAGLAGRVRNLFVFSGVPALYDPDVLAAWPHEPLRAVPMPRLQQLAYEWFFAGMPPEAFDTPGVKDSMANDCFGVAQDLRLRFADWGFSLRAIEAPVFMRHSRTDDAVPFEAALRTARLLPHCTLETVENGPHFSPEALDEFIARTMAAHYA